jgi:hypothetical protein
MKTALGLLLSLAASFVSAAPLPLRYKPAAVVSGAHSLPRLTISTLPGLSIRRPDVIAGGFIQPVLSMANGGDFWDGGGPLPEGSEEFEHVRRQEKKKEEVKQAHSERSVLDYLRARFNPEAGAEFLDQLYDVGGENSLSGRALLEPVVTEFAVHLDVPLDPSRVDMSAFGRSERELRDIAEAGAFSPQAYHRFLERAFREGLIYRLSDSGVSKTYYGVPYEVRQALSLKASEKKSEKPATAPAADSAFGSALSAFAERAKAMPKGEELIEFTADAVRAAKSGDGLKDALLTLLDSSDGTRWFDEVSALCELAVTEGILTRRQLDEALENL